MNIALADGTLVSVIIYATATLLLAVPGALAARAKRKGRSLNPAVGIPAGIGAFLIVFGLFFTPLHSASENGAALSDAAKDRYGIQLNDNEVYMLGGWSLREDTPAGRVGSATREEGKTITTFHLLREEDGTYLLGTTDEDGEFVELPTGR